MLDCDPIIPGGEGPTEGSDPTTVICPDPPIAGRDPVSVVAGHCLADGTPILLVFAPGAPINSTCPPIAGTPAIPGYVGWSTVAAPGTVTPGAPPAGVGLCGQRTWDHEIVCDVDPLTNAVIAVYSWVLTVDATVDPPVATWSAVTPGTAAPYVPTGVARFCGNERVELDASPGEQSTICAGIITYGTPVWSTDAVAWSVTAPAGPVSLGPCPCPPILPLGVLTDWATLR
jgi:hypothetical protein